MTSAEKDIGLIQAICGRSGIQIIAATGNHRAMPRPFREVSPDVIAHLHIRETPDGDGGMPRGRFQGKVRSRGTSATIPFECPILRPIRCTDICFSAIHL